MLSLNLFMKLLPLDFLVLRHKCYALLLLTIIPNNVMHITVFIITIMAIVM